MKLIAGGILRGAADQWYPNRVTRGEVAAIRAAGLPQLGNVYNLDFVRVERAERDERKHIAELLRDF